MKYLKAYILTFLVMFWGMVAVYAKSASISYEVSDEVLINSDIVVTVRLNNVEGYNIAGVGGQLKIETDYFQLIDVKSVSAPYEIWFNSENYKMAGLSFEAIGINKDTDILELTLRPLKVGATTLEFTEIELVSREAVKIDVNMVSKNIIIVANENEDVKVEEIIEEIKMEEETNMGALKVNEVCEEKANSFFQNFRVSNIKRLFAKNNNLVGLFFRNLLRRV